MKRMIYVSLAIACWACGDDGSTTDIDAMNADIDAMNAGLDAAANAGCRQSAECPVDESCVGPHDVVCGIPPQEECASDQECGPGNVCHVINDSCSQDGIGSMCGAPCTPGDACGDGLLCNAAGACRAIPCDDPAYDCPSWLQCNVAPTDPATPVHELDHQCRKVACTEDATCEMGRVCVNNYCQESLGQCSPPVP